MNILSLPSQTEENSLTKLFSLLGNPARLQILLLLGNGDACVCHLKEALLQRQAYISQQLMILRKAGLVSTMRKGRHIYYRLKQPEVLEIVLLTAELMGADIHLPEIKGLPGCPYPGEGK